MKLNPKQTQAIDLLEDNKTNELLFGGGAGGGKSILGTYALAKFSLKYAGSRWLMGRANMKTLKETTYQSFLKVTKMQGLKPNIHFTVTSAQHKEYPNCILFFNGSVILMKDLQYYPSDPEFDDLGSLEITGAFIDEANQITTKAKQIVRSRIRHNLESYGIIPKMLMTCNPAKNWTYKDFYMPFRNGELEPSKAFIQSLVHDNKDIDKHYIENLKTLDKQSRERLLYGNWEYDDDPAALMDFDSIQQLFTPKDLCYGNWYITADIARFGTDSTVIIVWNGWVGEKIIQVKKSSITQTADKIRELAAQYNIPMTSVIADEDGVGGGVVDMLGCKGFVNNSKPLPNPITQEIENYANLKSQCYFRLSERVCKKGVSLIADETQKEVIIQELEQVKQYKMDTDTKKRVMPKEKVKELLGRSPDYADSIMMREYFELKPKLILFA